MTEHSPENAQLFLTAAMPCPYLAGRQERKLFTHLTGRRAGVLHTLLTDNGFRRSQNLIYRPACDGCTACQSVRIVAQEFEPTARYRRVRKANEDIAVEVWRRLLEAARGNGGRDRDLARMRKVPAFWFRQMMRVYGFLDRHFHLPAVSRLDELRGGSAMVNDLSHAGMPPLRSYKPSRFADGSDSINLTLGPVETKLVMRDGAPAEVKVMPLFMRADHRLADAYQIGRFLAAVRETLQNPERLAITPAAQ